MFVTVREAADRAFVSERTIRRWIREGWLPALKMGGRYIMSLEDVGAAQKVAIMVHHRLKKYL